VPRLEYEPEWEDKEASATGDTISLIHYLWRTFLAQVNQLLVQTHPFQEEVENSYYCLQMKIDVM
jgi:hypothetical protein